MEVRKNEIVAIIGPNGAGKSTLLKTIFGLLKPSRGTIFLEHENITGLSPDAIARKGISYVPQVDNIFPSLTVKENLEMGGFIRKEQTAERISEIFRLFPVLEEKKHQRAKELSGGQRQMVAMGRALMLDPDILMLDEPSAGLAPKFVSMIFEKICEINAKGVSIILVEQNAREALTMAHTGYIFVTGKNVLHGIGKELLENPEIGQLYLGG
ncbi:MAG: ABC transporter ATP-binding protein [Spirochaetales bacterium]|nr:ABC transporter ATP-binding protein [Spirochaetales bacterium]